MPVIAEALMVQHFFHLCVYDMSLFQVLLFGEHGCPLERSKWLRHKERGTGNYLNLTETLLLGNLVILFRHFFS